MFYLLYKNFWQLSVIFILCILIVLAINLLKTPHAVWLICLIPIIGPFLPWRFETVKISTALSVLSLDKNLTRYFQEKMPWILERCTVTEWEEMLYKTQKINKEVGLKEAIANIKYFANDYYDSLFDKEDLSGNFIKDDELIKILDQQGDNNENQDRICK